MAFTRGAATCMRHAGTSRFSSFYSRRLCAGARFDLFTDDILSIDWRTPMAVVLIPDEHRRLDKDSAIREYLAPFGITHQRWPLEERVDPDAAPEAILAAYEPEIEALKRQGGYVTADVIDVSPKTPN